VTSSRSFGAWLAEQQVSLAFTTYQTNKLFLLGRHPDGRLTVVERTFDRCMGLWADGQTMWLSTRFQLWRFENALRPGETSTSTTWPWTAPAGWSSSPPCLAAWRR
jgi:uncharacterized protein (TIGR03032 family)